MNDADDDTTQSAHVARPSRGNPRHPRNTAASISARLLTLAHERREEYQLVLMRYGVERLLYRLGRSLYAQRFVVKGAQLFALWAQQAEKEQATEHARSPVQRHQSQHRATHDLDLLGFGPADQEQIERAFLDLCIQPVADDDGLIFLSDSLQAAPIRAEQGYGGIRIRLLAMLGKARIPLQIDVGFGDVVTPAPITTIYPILLRDLPAPQVRVYPRETVVAEKFEAMVRLGILNTRLKDFYDLWTLASSFPFEGEPLSAAVSATFSRRSTELPETTPEALTPRFGSDTSKQAQWTAFLRKGRIPPTSSPDLMAILVLLQAFLLTPCHALIHHEIFDATWPAGGPWIREDVKRK